MVSGALSIWIRYLVSPIPLIPKNIVSGVSPIPLFDSFESPILSVFEILHGNSYRHNSHIITLFSCIVPVPVCILFINYRVNYIIFVLFPNAAGVYIILEIVSTHKKVINTCLECFL